MEMVGLDHKDLVIVQSQNVILVEEKVEYKATTLKVPPMGPKDRFEEMFDEVSQIPPKSPRKRLEGLSGGIL